MRPIPQLKSVLKDIYDSEINFEISTFWHGMTLRLGDHINGFKAETRVMEWTEAETWLKEQAILHFPDSRFAMMYRDRLSADEADARLRERGERERERPLAGGEA